MRKVLLLATGLSTSLCAFAQQQTIRGIVKTGDDGSPAIGATVVVKGNAKVGAATDVDGRFTLSVPAGTKTLLVSYVGYKTKEVAVGPNLSVTLDSDADNLKDVVVVAYGKQKKVNLTGAVSSVDSKALAARPVQNVGQVLQGIVPGLNLSTTSGGGALDSRMNINIRGVGTIGEGSNSSPLVLIDGVEGDMNTLAPTDIESISVLKDASSSSIYGSRAAFGVILITTKAGREGKTHISYNGNVRFSTATQVPNMMDSETFAKYWNKASTNAGNSPVFSEETLEKIIAFKNGSTDPAIMLGTQFKPDDPEFWTKYGSGWANTDWFDYFYRKGVPSHEHNVAISGGNGKINYYVSAGLLNQRGLLKVAKDAFQRYNVTAKINAELYSWLNLSYTYRWTREDYERPSYMTGLFFHNITRRWPTNAILDPNGFLMPHNEALQLQDGGRQRNQKDYSNQSLVFTIKPSKPITIRLENNYNSVYNNQHWDVLPIYWHDQNKQPVAATWNGDYPAGASNVEETAGKTNYFAGKYFGEYANNFGKHELKVTAGLDVDISKYRDISGSRRDLITPLVPTLNTATHPTPSLRGGYNHWATMGMFARVNYAYDERYLAEVSVRRDGSSRYIGDKTWATFPSFSLGWNVSNEAFWKSLKGTISQLKLRGSWGQLGNTNTFSLYPWFLSLPVTAASTTEGSNWLINGQRQTIAGAPGIVTSSLTWERVESWNLGLDFALFNSRLQGAFDYFTRNTHDMVGPPSPISSLLGTAQPRSNNADMRTYGWELELRWRDQIGDFRYGAKLVLSDNQAEITKYYNPTNSLSTWYPGSKRGDIWGYTSAGIAKTDAEITEHLKQNKPDWGNNWAAGDMMYQDLDGDGKVSQGDYTLEKHGDLRIIGNSSPRYSYSLTLDAAYKGFDFSLLLQGIGKRDYSFDNATYFSGANVGLWQSVAFTEHWDFFRPEGDELGANTNAYYPRPLFGAGAKNFQTQTHFLQNAAYMRVKNIQLGYTIPQSVTNKWGISGLRVYVSVDNLATFTSLSKIFDPEALGGSWGAGKLYPLQRTWSMGVNLNF